MTNSDSTLSADAYSVGDVVADKYRLEALLGEGGQAQVFRATNLALEAEVAIKLVRRDTEDRAPGHRLLREAKAAARLGHAAIVRVFDLGETAAGDPFLVMELLSGQDLADTLVRRGKLAPLEAARILLPIADALVTAHREGLIHRDLKPANVFVATNGDRLQPKLLDFGIVKIRKPSSKRPSRPEAITNDGMVIGSLAYLSPEQARGLGDIDERADIWCFCTMMYECITGQTPFHGATYDKLLRSIINDEPIPISEHGLREEKLWGILKRGMAKSPDERWSSMHDLARELASWLVERGVQDDITGLSLTSRWLQHQVANEHPTNRADADGDIGALPDESMTGNPRGTTLASFSSARAPRKGGMARRNWLIIASAAAIVTVLFVLVDRTLERSDLEAKRPAAAVPSADARRRPEPRQDEQANEVAKPPIVAPMVAAASAPTPADADATNHPGPVPAATPSSSARAALKTPSATRETPLRVKAPTKPSPPREIPETDLLNPY